MKHETRLRSLVETSKGLLFLALIGCVAIVAIGAVVLALSKR